MRVTVCELRTGPEYLAEDLAGLFAHVQARGSDLVLLPELPFVPWMFTNPEFQQSVWDMSLAQHDDGMRQLGELAPALVLATRPVELDDYRLNEGFVLDGGGNYHPVHHKAFLPQEEGFHEQSWYHAAVPDFEPVEVGGVSIGYMICSELWFMEHARTYASKGTHIVATPRATERGTVDKWLAGGRAAAVIAGAFSLSSNHVIPPEDSDVYFGGQGWIISPDGEVLALTSRDNPYVTVEIDLAAAERAKSTYPRYIDG